MSRLAETKARYARFNFYEKIIAINAAIYGVLWVLLRLFYKPTSSFLNWFELPEDVGELIVQPWSLISYGFLHYDFWHLFFNMLILYFVGQIFLNLFSAKMALNVYFLGILFGAIFFLLANILLPDSIFKSTGSLIGASAGVQAVLFFLWTYMPQSEVRILKFNVKLWYIGVLFLIIDFVGLFGTNSGGHMAHFGGVFLGYLYAVQLKKGTDIGKGFEKVMDGITTLFKPKSRSKLKTVHKSKKEGIAGHEKKDFDEFNNQKKIDLILDKISKSGYESLTKKEKELLFKAGKNN